MGWITVLLLAIVAVGAFFALRLRGGMLQLASAAILFGAAGYAVQGHPALPGTPREAASRTAPIPMTELRHRFFGQFTGTEHWLLISESYARRGQTRDAVGALNAAVRAHPGDPQLWIGLGNALVDHAGVLTPAAELAYRRAAELAPGHPAAPYFMGLALARSGAPQGALQVWQGILPDAPAEASWRPLVEDSIAALEGRRPKP